MPTFPHSSRRSRFRVQKLLRSQQPERLGANGEVNRRHLIVAVELLWGNRSPFNRLVKGQQGKWRLIGRRLKPPSSFLYLRCSVGQCTRSWGDKTDGSSFHFYPCSVCELTRWRAQVIQRAFFSWIQFAVCWYPALSNYPSEQGRSAGSSLLQLLLPRKRQSNI